MSELDYNELDPGIRYTVRWLHSIGFDTTDSGDGVSKPEMECAIDVPNVMISCDPHLMAAQADSLMMELQAIGIDVAANSQGDGKPEIHASYDPANRTPVIILLGLDDDMLLSAMKKHAEQEAANERAY